VQALFKYILKHFCSVQLSCDTYQCKSCEEPFCRVCFGCWRL